MTNSEKNIQAQYLETELESNVNVLVMLNTAQEYFSHQPLHFPLIMPRDCVVYFYKKTAWDHITGREKKNPKSRSEWGITGFKKKM